MKLELNGRSLDVVDLLAYHSQELPFMRATPPDKPIYRMPGERGIGDDVMPGLPETAAGFRPHPKPDALEQGQRRTTDSRRRYHDSWTFLTEDRAIEVRTPGASVASYEDKIPVRVDGRAGFCPPSASAVAVFADGESVAVRWTERLLNPDERATVERKLAAQLAAQSAPAPPPPEPGPGRPPKRDDDELAGKVWRKWQTGNYATYKELKAEFPNVSLPRIRLLMGRMNKRNERKADAKQRLQAEQNGTRNSCQ